jgi:hypothetical protein
VRIHDDVTAPRLSISSTTVVEGNVWAQLVITLSAPAPTTVTVTVRTYDGTAKAGEDYRSLVTSITLQPGQTSAIVEIRIIGDSTPEPDEYFTVELSDPVGAVIDQGVGMVTITELRPTVSVEATTATADEVGAVPGVFTITRTVTTQTELTVLLSWSGTATYGSDYTLTVTGGTLSADRSTLLLAAGVTTATITVTPVPDTLVEGNETVTLTLATSSAYDLAAARSATITILDAPPPPTVTVAFTTSAVTVTEGNKNWTYQLVVRLSAPSTTPVTVRVTTADGTATAIRDYRSVATTITFPAGVTELTVPITIIGDKTAEQTEWFSVTLSDVTGATLGDPSTIIITILDDDAKKLTAAQAADEPSTATTLTTAELERVATVAVELWRAAGADPQTLQTIRYEVTDLEGLTLAETFGRLVLVDATAAGHGWWTDPHAPVPPDRIDLLTVLLHELGHVLGYDHVGDPAHLMHNSLEPGVRLVPTVEEQHVSRSVRVPWSGVGRQRAAGLVLEPPVQRPPLLSGRPRRDAREPSIAREPGAGASDGRTGATVGDRRPAGTGETALQGGVAVRGVGLPPRVASACPAETVVLALAPRACRELRCEDTPRAGDRSARRWTQPVRDPGSPVGSRSRAWRVSRSAPAPTSPSWWTFENLERGLGAPNDLRYAVETDRQPLGVELRGPDDARLAVRWHEVRSRNSWSALRGGE